MPYREVTFQAGETYHLFNRGVNHQRVFFCKDNWSFFIKRLRRYFRPEYVDILAHCLMPTHYHLIIALKTDDLSSRVMQPFSLSYTKSVNRQQDRVGPLFQGPFRAIHVDKDEYLLHLSRYIHMNPVTAELVARPEDWAFSSYRDYIGLRNGTLPATEVILSQFPSPDAYREFVESYSEQKSECIDHLKLE